MSVDQNREPPQERPHVERAEDLLNRLGQRFAQSRTQFSQALEQRAGRTNGTGGAPDTRAATERAEEMLDRAGERVGAFASTASYQVRRWLARAREEAEDILAEARSVNQRDDSGTPSTDRGDATSRTTRARTDMRTKPAGETAPKRAARSKPANAAAAAKSAATTTATAARTAISGRPRGTRKSAKAAEESRTE